MRLKIIIFIILISTTYLFYNLSSKSKIKVKKITTNIKFESDVSSIKLYLCIEKYSKEYGVPIDYLKSIAYQETKYGGPNDFNYYPEHISPGNALGPMQVQLASARLFDNNIEKDDLLSDIDSNVRISAKILRYLYNQYGDWQLAFGAYNTGHPVKNGYSKMVKDKDFKWKK